MSWVCGSWIFHQNKAGLQVAGLAWFDKRFKNHWHLTIVVGTMYLGDFVFLLLHSVLILPTSRKLILSYLKFVPQNIFVLTWWSEKLKFLDFQERCLSPGFIILNLSPNGILYNHTNAKMAVTEIIQCHIHILLKAKTRLSNRRTHINLWVSLYLKATTLILA